MKLEWNSEVELLMVKEKSCVSGPLNFLEYVEIVGMHLQAMLGCISKYLEEHVTRSLEITEFLKEG